MPGLVVTRAAVLVGFLALVSGCGPLSGLGTAILALSSGDGSTSSPASPLLVSADVGPTGKYVVHPGGASASIPAQALAADTTITIAPAADVASGSLFTSVGPAFSFGPSGATFAADVTIELPFDPTAVPLGTPDSDFVVLRREDRTGT